MTHEYRSKRDFSRTPEPAAAAQPRQRPAAKRSAVAVRPPTFVVHRHEARRLHYDLRLEMNGVLKSWAVPKGFSYFPSDKRLAVHTEDHPLEYESFSGMIPRGQYGGGTMSIWDRGHYELLTTSNGESAIQSGKLEVRFFGGRLRGEWHLVKLKRGRDEWLLFKARDRYAREKDEPSVGLDLGSTPRKPLPKRVRRMEPGRGAKTWSSPDWLFELRLSGRRLFVEKQGDLIQFRGLPKRLASTRLAPIADAVRRMKADVALLDGVLVCLDEQHRPSRPRLADALAGRVSTPLSYYAFDLLYYEEWDLRDLPLVERKAALNAVLPNDASLQYLDHERSRAEELIATVAAVGLDGVVAKRADSRYTAGASKDWIEVTAARGARARSAAGTGDPEGDLVEALGRQARRHVPKRALKVRVTNPDKVLWPRDGYTKRELIEYYDAIADVLLPYLQDRPLSLKRFPDGIDGESFFQKDAPPHTPDWVRTSVVRSLSRREAQNRFVICDDRATLLYLANLAAIELHPWASRVADLEHPDWAILDLDPDGTPFPAVMRTAREIGKLLSGLGLRAAVKTSGSKGIHVYVPLAPGYTYDQARMFCEGIGRRIVTLFPRLTTMERVKGRREGRVYIDVLQNRRGQTIAAPYTARPVPGAWVSAPLDWDELSGPLDPSLFTIQSMPERVARVGDRFTRALWDRQDLLPAIERFRELLASEKRKT